MRSGTATLAAPHQRCQPHGATTSPPVTVLSRPFDVAGLATVRVVWSLEQAGMPRPQAVQAAEIAIAVVDRALTARDGSSARTASVQALTDEALGLVREVGRRLRGGRAD